MKTMLLAACLLSLTSLVRAEDKPAGAGGNPEIKAERQEFKKEMKAERMAFTFSRCALTRSCRFSL